MPTFIYQAIDKKGSLKEGEIEASSKERVLDYILHGNLKPVSIKEKKVFSLRGLFFKKIKREELIALVESFSVMLTSGVTLIEAVEVIEQDEPNPTLRKILGTIKFGLESGRPLSEILREYPAVFSPIFIGLIEAGEKSGNLDKTLSNLEAQLKKDAELYTKIKNALIYPSILVIAIVGVLVLLFTLVLPKIATVFREANITVPLITRILIFLSQVLGHKPWLTFLIIFILVLSFYFLLRLRVIRNLFVTFFNKLPIISQLIFKLDLARFTRTLGTLLASGLPLVQSLDLTKGALTTRYHPVIPRIIEDVKKGVSLANSTKRESAFFPRLLTSMLNVGEKTGQTDKILIDLARFYERNIDATLKNLISLIEPILLLIVGAVIGAIALSIVLPIYQLIGKLGG